MDTYGFAGSVATNVFMAVYLFWALAPAAHVSAWLPFLPDPYWALVPPAVLLVFISTYGTVYVGLGLLVAGDSVWAVGTDGHTRRLRPSDFAQQRDEGGRGGDGPAPSAARPTPEFGDVPLRLVRRLEKAAIA